jgi:hypothetical protein
MTPDEQKLFTDLLFSHKHLWTTFETYRYLQEHPEMDWETAHDRFFEEADEVYQTLADVLLEGKPIEDSLHPPTENIQKAGVLWGTRTLSQVAKNSICGSSESGNTSSQAARVPPSRFNITRASSAPRPSKSGCAAISRTKSHMGLCQVSPPLSYALAFRGCGRYPSASSAL